jgi:hypothetical protein
MLTTTKLALALSLLTVACSGASASIDGEQPPVVNDLPPAPSGSSTSTQPGPDQKKAVQADASPDASTLDSGADSSLPEDAGTDAAVVVDPTPRFGVAFDGTANQRVLAELPADLAGQTSVTFEGYFDVRTASSSGLRFNTPAAYCAVVTTARQVASATRS